MPQFKDMDGIDRGEIIIEHTPSPIILRFKNLNTLVYEDITLKTH